MKRALITGITGFVGSHLAERLLFVGMEVHGLYRPRSRTENIERLAADGKVHLIQADIRDGHSVQRVIADLRPDCIFHLAGQSFIPQSHHAPVDTIETNVAGTLHVLEAVRQLRLDAVVHIAGSSEEYGAIQPDEVPVTELTPLRPRSPYAVSKVAADMLGQQYWHSHKVKTVITRAFNHEGPRRGDVFVTSTFAKQIAEIELTGKKGTLHHGNLDAFRDFTDVRDTVRAYELAVHHCEYGQVYNICSGRPWRIGDMLDCLIAMSHVPIRKEPDPARMRPSDINIFAGAYSKFKTATGWEPQIPFEHTLIDLLNYWRERVRANLHVGSPI